MSSYTFSLETLEKIRGALECAALIAEKRPADITPSDWQPILALGEDDRKELDRAILLRLAQTFGVAINRHPTLAGRRRFYFEVVHDGRFISFGGRDFETEAEARAFCDALAVPVNNRLDDEEPVVQPPVESADRVEADDA